MRHFRFFGIAVVFCVGLFLNLPFSIAQDIPATRVAESDDKSEPADPLRITVNVNEIRLDVVVVDGKGRPITDLTADDFEVYQDRLPQDVTSSIYINDQTAAAASPAAARKDAPNLSPRAVSGKTLKEEEVRRTIVFVVDNLSMTDEEMRFAKMALKRFIERQMQPGDMVAIMRTGYGNSVLDMFLSDKRQIFARIDGLHVELAMPARIYGSQLNALSYGIRALRDMPGRKIIFLVTSEPTIDNPFDNFTTPTEDGGSELTPNSERPQMNDYELYGSNFDRLADEALRSGVVVHLLDAVGLCVPIENPACEAHIKKNMENPWNPLPAKTGGIIVKDNNFFVDGIGEDANNMIAGYYLISYTPPPDTFDRNTYRRVSVRVKRRGASVHTREGFYSRTGSEPDFAGSPAHPLQNAIFSPFQHPGLNVNMAAGYIKDAKAGYLIRSWIHLDPKDVKIVETEDGGARIDLETACLTSGINADVQDIRHVKYTFNIEPENKSENIAWIQKHGIRFTLLLPVKKPDSYTVRIAVRDAESGRTGAAHQFLEIPDLKKKGMELSSIFMLTSADDLNWMRSDLTKEITEGMFFPVLRKDAIRTPALRSYASGDRLQAMAMLYNADMNAIARGEIEVQSIIYKDGVEILRGEPKPVAPDKVENIDGVTLFCKLTIGSDLPPGDYLLQLLVTDKKYSRKRDEGGVFSESQGIFSKIMRAYLNEDKNYDIKGVASQTLNFTVAEEQ